MINLKNCWQWCRKIYILKELEKDIEKEEETIKEREKIIFVNLEEEAWRREELNLRNRDKNKEELEKDIPEKYEDFKDQVFNKAVFDQLPDQSKWDHAI